MTVQGVSIVSSKAGEKRKDPYKDLQTKTKLQKLTEVPRVAVRALSTLSLSSFRNQSRGTKAAAAATAVANPPRGVLT